MMNRRKNYWMVLLAVLLVSFLCAGNAFARETYRVKRGDTLAELSRTFHVSVRDLRAANHLRGNALKAHTVIVIPRPEKVRTAAVRTDKKQNASVSSAPVRYYTVKRGETLFKVAAAHGVSPGTIKRMNHLRSNRLRTGQKIALPTPASPPAVASRERNLDEPDEAVRDEVSEEIADDDLNAELPAERNGEQTAGSGLLGKWDSIMERQLLVKVAQGFIGAPYRLGGSTVRGIDCSGFVKKIYDIFNVMLPRTAREQSGVGQYVSRNELEEGDLVFFHTRRAIGHVGIYIGNGQFVHASSGRDRMVRVSSLNEPYYSTHYVKAVRLKGMKGL